MPGKLTKAPVVQLAARLVVQRLSLFQPAASTDSASGLRVITDTVAVARKCCRTQAILFAIALAGASFQVHAAVPVAVDDNFNTGSGQTVNGVLSVNDLNLDGPSDTYSLNVDAVNGVVSVNADSSFSYTPNIGYAGTDNFTYLVEDGTGGNSTATVSITVAGASNFISAANNFIIGAEDTSIPLGLSVADDLYSGGALQDLISSDNQFRADDAGGTPVVSAIPANATSITVTGFSTQSRNTAGADDTDDDYQLLNARIDLVTGTSSGQVAFLNHGKLNLLDQYSWEGVPLGDAVLDDATKVIGYSTGASNPVFSISANNLQITENHQLETAYVIEYMTSNGDSTNFIRAGNTVQTAGESVSSLAIPPLLRPASGKHGIVIINSLSAAAGSNFAVEHKGFSRLVIDLDTLSISGSVAAQQGETENNTVTYSFSDYPLVDQQISAATPTSILSSGANIVGDTTAKASVLDDVTIYIDTNGDLKIERAAGFASVFTSMYTSEFYARTGFSSIASFVSVSSDDAEFDASPADNVDSNGKTVNQLKFAVPASAQVGIFHVSWNTIGGTDTNENIGMGFAVVDLSNGVSSGSTTFIRASTPDLVSWDAVPFGTTFFGATDSSGNPLYQSNKTAGSFTDGYGQTASFTLVNNGDGSRDLLFDATSSGGTQTFRDYRGNAHISWLGNEPFSISGVPIDGSLSAGAPLPNGDWEIDFSDLPTLEYRPVDHFSGTIPMSFELSSTGETLSLQIIVEPVADGIAITANDHTGYENSSLPLQVVVTPSPDTDGSEQTIASYRLDNVDSTVTLSATSGTVSNNSGGSWDVDSAALASLTATGTVSSTSTITISALQTDNFDIDGDSSIEDTNNGAGVDEYDELAISETFDLTINTPPAVDSLVINNGTPVITGSASVSADETLSVTVNGNTYTAGDGNLIDNGDGTWVLTIPAADTLAENTYSVTATLSHSGGASASDTTADELIVDLTPPPAPGVTSQTTTNTTPVISGTTTVGTGLVLQVIVNGVTYTAGDGNLVDNNDGTWDLTIPATDTLPDALYQVVATLTDAAGNSSSDPGVDDLLIDTTAPVTPGVTSLVTNNGAPVVAGTAQVGTGETLAVTINGVTYTAGDGNLIDSNDGTWSLAIPSANTLPEATYDVTASITDIAGNISTDPSSAELIIDLTAPVAPTVNATLVNTGTPTLTGGATVAAGEILTVTVNAITYTAGDGNLTDNADGTWTLVIASANALAEAVYDVQATVSDAAGNSTTDSTIDELTVDLTPPVIPTVVSQVTNNPTPTITGTATVNGTDVFSVTVGPDTYSPGPDLTISAGLWTLIIPAGNDLAEQSYDVAATVTDAAGNASIDNTTDELIIDLTPPPAPGVTSQTTLNPTPVISGTSPVASGLLLSVEVNGIIYTEGDGNLVDNGDGTWDLQIPTANMLADALYQVVATLTDAAGNVSADPGIDELLVDTTAPPTPGVTSLTTNTGTPVIDGVATLTIGDILTVEVNGITYTDGDGNLTSDAATGTWSLVIPAANTLPESTYSVTATITDSASNSSSDPSSDELLIDLTAPAVPTVIAQQTNNPTPVITGTAVLFPGEILTVAVNGVTYTAGDGNLVDNTDGTWDLTIPAANVLPEGTLDVTATVADAAGNSITDTTGGELILDITAPTPPTVTSLLTNNITPAIAGSSTLSATDTLTVTVNGISYVAGDGNLVLNADGTWMLTIPAANALTENTYEVTATATDSVGNSAVDTTVNELVVDLTPPPAPGVTSQTTTNPTPVISGTTTIGTGTGSGLLLQVTVNGTTYTAGDGNLVDNNDGTWDLAIPVLNPLPDALYQVVATLTDAAGNTSTDPGIDELLVDTTAPPSPGVTSLTTNVTAPVIEGTAIVAGNETLTVAVNGVTYTAGDGNLVDNTDGTWTLSIPATDALVENTYAVTATVTDIAGNGTSDPSTNELLIDTTAPVAPSADILVTNNTAPTITGSAIVGTGETLTVTVNGIAYIAGDGNLVDNTDGTWTLTIPPTDALAEGILDVSVVVTDAAGNSGADISTAELTIDLTPPAVPTVVSLLTNNDTPVLNGTATLLAGDSLSVTVDSISYIAGDGNLTDNTDGTWTLTIPAVNALSENTFEVSAAITDIAGNSSDDITSNELIVDLTPPPAPGVTSQTTTNTTPVISGTTAIGSGLLLQVTVNSISYTDGDGSLVNNGDGTWDLMIPAGDALPEALYQVVATLSDAAGNNSVDPGSNELLVDTTAPPSPGATSLTTNLTSPVIEGTAIVAVGDILTVAVNGITYTAGDGNLVDNTDGTWTLAIPAANALPENTYEVIATVTDIAGNASNDPSVDELLIDTTAPVSPTADNLVTNNTEPTITGSATVSNGETLTVSVDGITYTAGDGDLIDNTDDTWTLLIPAANTLAENVFDVSVTVTDAAGNSSADTTTNELTIDLTPPPTPSIAITEDTNNDGLISSAEPSGDIDLSVSLPAGVGIGDTVQVTDGSTVLSAVVTASDIASGATGFTLPAATDGVLLNVEATLTDITGNVSPSANDTALFDFSPPSAPQALISEDSDNDAFINISESTVNSPAEVDIAIFLPLDAVAGDTLNWSIDGSVNSLTLSGVHVAAGVINITAPNTYVDNDTISLSAHLTDIAGNVSVSGADTAVYDLTAPVSASVVNQTTNLVTPIIEGTATTNPGDTLIVTVNAVTYTAGDGNLVDNADGTWTLTIPAANSLSENNFDVSVTVTDNAGNSTSDSSTSELTVDLTPPPVPTVDTLVTNNTSPTITGTAVIAGGDTLSVTVDSIVYTAGDGNLTDNTDGTWTLVIPSANALVESVFDVIATVTDVAGNASVDASIDELTIDLTPPTIPTVTSLLTNNITPTIGGTAALTAGDTFSVSVNGITYTIGDGNLINNADDTWTLTIPAINPLSENIFEVVASSTDPVGNMATDATTNELIVDLTPPPAPGVTSQTTANPTPVISGTTAIGSGLVLQVTVNGVTYTAGDGNLVDNNDGTWDLTIPLADTLADALYQVVATLTDAAGNTSTDPGSNELLVDTTAPPSPGVTSLTTNQTSPVLEGTAIVNAGETLTVTVNAITYTAGDGNLVDNNDGTWTLSIPVIDALAENTYEVTATITDSAGNNTSDPSIDELLVDTTAPVSPTVDVLVTNNTAPTITGTATVAGGETLAVTVDGITYNAGDGNLVDNTDGTWSLAIPVGNALAENIFDVTVIVTDIAGNSSSDVTIDELTVDLTPPAAPTVLSLSTNNINPTITGTASTGTGDTLTVTVNGVSYTAGDGSLVDNADGTWTLTIPPTDALVESVLDVDVTVTDQAGNSNADISNSELTIDLTPPAVPTVTTLVTNIANPVITGTATLVAGDTLGVAVDGVTYTAGDGNLVANNDGTWTLTIPAANALFESTFDVDAVNTDLVGNSATDLSSAELIVDLTPPPAPGVTSQTTTNPTPVISGTTAIDTSLTLQVTVNGIVYTAGDGNLVDNNDGTWDLTIPLANTLPDALYQVIATLTDPAGNSSTDPGSNELVIDTTAPPSPGVTSLTTNLTSPVIEGNAIVNAGETLTVTVNAVTYTAGDGNLVDNNDGTWSLTIPASDALAESTYEVTATITDAAGNTTSDPSINELLVDTTAPVSPTVNMLITNNATPVITGTATIGTGETLSVVTDGVTYTAGDGNLIDNTDGTWSLAVPAASALTENDYDVTAVVTDIAGNSSSDITIDELTVDLTAPAVPAVIALLTNNPTPVITGTAILLPGETLSVLVDGITYTAGDGNLADNTDGTWTLTIPAASALIENIYDVSVVVTDPAGNTGSDNTIDELTVDLTSPVAPTVISLSTNNVNPTITGTASTAPGDILTVVVNGVSYVASDGNLVDNADGTWTLVIPAADALAESVLDVSVTITDAAGNSNTDISNNELTVDLTPPSVPTVVSLVTNTTNPVINGTATLSAGDSLSVIVDGITYTAGDGNLLDNNDGTWALTIPASTTLIESTYDVDAISTDAVGNTATDLSSTELIVDLTPPAIPTVVALVTNIGDPVITGTATLAAGDSLSVTVDGTTYIAGDGLLAVNNDGTWSLSIPVANALAENIFDVNATVTDIAGNASSDSSIDELLIDTTAPPVPAVNTLVTNNTTPAITGTATPINSGLLTVTVNGITYTDGDGNLLVNSDGSWTLDIPNGNELAEGVYDVALTVVDAAGNSSTDTSTLELLVDLTAPSAPGITSMASQTGTPVIVGTSVPAPDTTLTVMVNGVTYTQGDGHLLVNADGTWSLTIPANNSLADDLYEVVATLTDLAGNQNSDPGTNELLVDTITPILPGVTSLTTNSATPALYGTAVVGNGEALRVTVNGVHYTAGGSELSVTLNDTWVLQIPPQHALAEGNYDVTALVSDSAGNSSVDPSSGELLIDMTAPDLATVVSQLTNDPTPVIGGQATLGSGETLAVTVNGTTYTAGDGVLVHNGDGTWQLNLPQPLGDGDYEVVVTVTDTAGNSVESVGSLLIDTTEPSIDIESIADKNTASPALTGITDQADGSTVFITDADGDPVCNAVVAANTWQCVPDTPLNYGPNSLNASITDAAGNSASIYFDVPIDTDFDGDGIENAVEGNQDFDGDGIPDLLDRDTDNDGIPDNIEGNKDTDSDGIPDYRDRDADNDGIADVVEAGAADIDRNFILDTLTDTDADGLADYVQSNPLALTDTDFDGYADYLDVDSDQDGIPDLVELGGSDTDNDGRIDNVQDNNADGIDDAVSLLPFAIAFTDNDNKPDHLDLDSDQDGTFDLTEAGGTDLNFDGIVDSMTDADKDGIPDSVDVTFTLGIDIDADGIDDRMDISQLLLLDDTTPDTTFAGAFANDATTTDTDNDGIADQFDPDSNGDGYADDVIVALAIGMALPDGDNNGTPDFQQASSGVILTGLRGHAGCSLGGRQVVDPLLAMIVFLAFTGLARRSTRRLLTFTRF